MLLLEELGEQADPDQDSDLRDRHPGARGGACPDRDLTRRQLSPHVSPARLKRFFVKVDHSYQIQKSIRDLCVFARHDLAKDPPFSRLDLISCRNVLIYMGAALQRQVLSMFQYALKPGGFLFLGKSESISDYSDAFTAEDRKHRIFLRKPPSPGFREFPLPAGAFPALSAAAPKPAPARAVVDFRKEAEFALLEHYAPPALVVDSDLHIVHFQGDTSPYLAPATGQPSFHLLKMVRPELVVDLRTAIDKARKQGRPAHVDDVQFKHEGQPAAVRLEVQPLKKIGIKKQDLLVVFQRVQAEREGEVRRQEAHFRRTRLNRELASTREHLRALISEHETAQEEMKAANEEILSSNEELQSTNEELETAQEELQSSNEELSHAQRRVAASQRRVGQLTHDLNNLLVGVDIPVLVLDGELRVLRLHSRGRHVAEPDSRATWAVRSAISLPIWTWPIGRSFFRR